MDIIIIGCGRVGSQLGVLLSKSGHNVSIIDRNPDSFKSLGRDFNGRTIRGLGFDEDVLEQAGIKDADVVVAATNLDNTNLMSAEVARRLYNVPHVITRLYNPDRASAYQRLGLDYVCGTTLVSEELFAKIRSGNCHHMDTFGDFEVISFSFKSPQGLPVRVKDIEKDGRIRISVFEHEGTVMTPIPESVLHQGDQVIAAVQHGDLDSFSIYMQTM